MVDPYIEVIGLTQETPNSDFFVYWRVVGCVNSIDSALYLNMNLEEYSINKGENDDWKCFFKGDKEYGSLLFESQLHYQDEEVTFQV